MRARRALPRRCVAACSKPPPLRRAGASGLVAARRAAAAVQLARPLRAAKYFTLPQSGGAAARRAGLLAFAMAGLPAGAGGGNAPPDAAAAATEPVLAPQLCVLELRVLARSLERERKSLAEWQHKAAVEQSKREWHCQGHRERLLYCQVLRLQCERAGDALGVERFGRAEASSKRALRAEEQRLAELIASGFKHCQARDAAANLKPVEHEYNVLRAYTVVERHGAEWVEKAALPHGKLSDDELRNQAHEWYASQAPQ